MLRFGENTWGNTLRRIGLSFGSLLAGVTMFSLFFCVFVQRGIGIELLLVVFSVAIVYACPVWCLYLPFVIALKTAEGWRIWPISASGIFIGPTSLALWGVMRVQGGADPQMIWQGDPLLCGLGGMTAGIVFALIVGILTTSFYVTALKWSQLRPAAARGRVSRGAI